MENKKVKELKFIAKKYGLHRYSKLRKAELIHLIKEHERKVEEDLDSKHRCLKLYLIPRKYTLSYLYFG